MLAPDLLLHVPSMLDGVVLTHRLTDGERESDTLLAADLPGFSRMGLRHGDRCGGREPWPRTVGRAGMGRRTGCCPTPPARCWPSASPRTGRWRSPRSTRSPSSPMSWSPRSAPPTTPRWARHGCRSPGRICCSGCGPGTGPPSPARPRRCPSSPRRPACRSGKSATPVTSPCGGTPRRSTAPAGSATCSVPVPRPGPRCRVLDFLDEGPPDHRGRAGDPARPRRPAGARRRPRRAVLGRRPGTACRVRAAGHHPAPGGIPAERAGGGAAARRRGLRARRRGARRRVAPAGGGPRRPGLSSGRGSAGVVRGRPRGRGRVPRPGGGGSGSPRPRARTSRRSKVTLPRRAPSLDGTRRAGAGRAASTRPVTGAAGPRAAAGPSPLAVPQGRRVPGTSGRGLPGDGGVRDRAGDGPGPPAQRAGGVRGSARARRRAARGRLVRAVPRATAGRCCRPTRPCSRRRGRWWIAACTRCSTPRPGTG